MTSRSSSSSQPVSGAEPLTQPMPNRALNMNSTIGRPSSYAISSRTSNLIIRKRNQLDPVALTKVAAMHSRVHQGKDHNEHAGQLVVVDVLVERQIVGHADGPERRDCLTQDQNQREYAGEVETLATGSCHHDEPVFMAVSEQTSREQNGIDDEKADQERKADRVVRDVRQAALAPEVVAPFSDEHRVKSANN